MNRLDKITRALTFTSALMILGAGGNYSYRSYKLFDKYETQANVEADIIKRMIDGYKPAQWVRPDQSPLLLMVREMIERENEAAFYKRAKKNPLLIPYYTWLVNHGYENPIESKLYESFRERHENQGTREIRLDD